MGAISAFLSFIRAAFKCAVLMFQSFDESATGPRPVAPALMMINDHRDENMITLSSTAITR